MYRLPGVLSRRGTRVGGRFLPGGRLLGWVGRRLRPVGRVGGGFLPGRRRVGRVGGGVLLGRRRVPAASPVRLLVAAVQPVEIGIVSVVAHGLKGYPSAGLTGSAACLPARRWPAVHPCKRSHGRGAHPWCGCPGRTGRVVFGVRAIRRGPRRPLHRFVAVMVTATVPSARGTLGSPCRLPMEPP